MGSKKSTSLNIGKIPADMLAKWLAKAGTSHGDAGLVIGPSTGEDSAIIEPPADELLVVTSDPITFATHDIGEYAVAVSANDVATSGGTARWFFATVLLPPGIESTRAEIILDGLSSACARSNIVLAGGHTEITDAVTRPVVSGTLVGTVVKGRLVDKKSMAPGNCVMVTKAVAVEGSSILATVWADRLQKAGVPQSDLDYAAKLVERIDVRPDAGNACDIGGVTAMHDVTEGGIVTALYELGAFGRLRIDLDLIPVLPECRRMCDVLGIDPLGLIGSGSLLIVCDAERGDDISARLEDEHIGCVIIGTVIEGSSGVEWNRSGETVAAPYFEVDEIARL